MLVILFDFSNSSRYRIHPWFVPSQIIYIDYEVKVAKPQRPTG